MTDHNFVQRDLSVLWHPCTQMHDHERLPMIPIRSAKGVWLEDFDGKRYIDGISSWWVNIFGHCNPRIAAAIADQLGKLEHVLLAGFSHQPALELAEELVRVTPAGLDRVFYADNGSAAVEVALKMSFHYWRNIGQPQKQRFVAISGGYHGETLGALGVSDLGLYKEIYDPLLIKPILVSSPDSYQAEIGESAEAFAKRRLQDVEALFAQQSNQIAAFIIEPLVQCAGGMRMFHPAYLTGLRKLCTQYDVLLIADEIAVGFGRTGTLFACEQAGISPDLMCLSKGLTGGFLPLAAVMATDSIYQAFYGDYNSGKAFLHSHSYTGNPLACRAALETLAIFREQPVLQENIKLAQYMGQSLEPLRDHPNVGDIRQTGMIAAVELIAKRNGKVPFPATERRGLRAYQSALKNGALLRPLGNVLYMMPPYCITETEIELLANALIQGVTAAVRD